MKIALVIPRYGEGIVGGAEAHCRGLAEHLARNHEVEVLTSCADDYLSWTNVYPAGTEHINGVLVKRFPTRRERDHATFGGVCKPLVEGTATPEQEQEFIDALGPCVPGLVEYIHANRVGYSWFIFFDYRYYTTVKGVPAAADRAIVVPLVHPGEDSLKLNVYRAVFRRPAGILYNSPESRSHVHRMHNNCFVPNAVIGVGFDPEPMGSAQAFREKFDISEPFVLYVGRTEAHKGCDELFRLFVRHKANCQGDLKLVLVGGGSLAPPDHDDIVQLGYLPEADKRNAMRAASVLINPSPLESFSMVLMESWIEGTPVIVSGSSPVMRGHIKRSGGGLCYDAEAAFTAALDYYLGSPAEATRAGMAGRSYVKSHYTWERVLTKLEGFLQTQTVRRCASGDASTLEPDEEPSTSDRIASVERELQRMQRQVRELQQEQQVLRTSATAVENAEGRNRLHTRTPLLETGFILSVVVVTCNRLPQLRWCLETLEAACMAARDVLPEIEVLVCDDGGDDGTLDFIRSRHWNMRVKYLFQQNDLFGAGSNRNQGLVQSKGKYLLFLDADCAVEPEFLLQATREFESNPWDILLPERRYLQRPLRAAEKLEELEHRCNITDRGEDMEVFYRGADNRTDNWHGAHSLAFGMARQVAELIGLFDARFTSYGFEDSDYFFRAYRNFIHFNYSRAVRVYHQPHEIDETPIERSSQRFYAKHHIGAIDARQRRILRLLGKLERGEKINILIDPGGVNAGIENSITFSQSDICQALRSAGHKCTEGQGAEGGDWDLVLSVISHADNASRTFSGFEYYPKAAFVVGETTRIPPRWVHGYANAVDIILAKTSHVRHALASSGTPWPRLHTVLPPLSPSFLQDPERHDTVNQLLGQLEGRFVFFTHFQSASTFYGRKAWRPLLDAYAREFAGDERTALLISTDEPGVVRSAVSSLPSTIAAQVIVHDKSVDWMSNEELADLYRRVDCYVMPSVEGWGKTQLEAMAMGTPTVGLCWGGVLDFMPFYGGHLVRLDDHRLRHCGFAWLPDGVIPAPDPEHLGEVMGGLRREYGRHKAASLKAVEAIRERFGARSFASRFENALISVARHIVAA